MCCRCRHFMQKTVHTRRILLFCPCMNRLYLHSTLQKALFLKLRWKVLLSFQKNKTNPEVIKPVELHTCTAPVLPTVKWEVSILNINTLSRNIILFKFLRFFFLFLQCHQRWKSILILSLKRNISIWIPQCTSW